MSAELAQGAPRDVCGGCNGMGYLDGVGTRCGKCAGEGAAPAAPVAAPLTDELTGKLMRIHAALGKMGKKYGEIGSRDVDVARWNADLYEAIAAVGGVLADQPLEQLARIKLEGGQG